MVTEKTMVKLELPAIREGLAAITSHPLSRKWAREMALASTFQQCEDRLYETQSAMELLRTRPDCPMGSLPDMEEAINKGSKGFLLNSLDLWHEYLLLKEAWKIRSYFQKSPGNPLFQGLLSGISDIQYLRERLEKTVEAGGVVRDQASPALAAIRRNLRGKSAEIRKVMDRMLKSNVLQSYLQEGLVVRRGESFCLSVKREYAGKVPGVIVDTSASGSTLFIEPSEAVRLRGEVNLLKKEEEREIEAILRELSALIHVEKESLLMTFETMGRYNLFLSRALYTRQFKGFVPAVNQEGRIRLREARHPLLTGTVVSNDFFLGEGFSHLIISGPNTGGKTVLLKMIGLFALMISLGLGLPAGEGSEMAFFRDVLADIGDEQSIENSLSTFSGHMYNVREMVEAAGPETLLLFDELGNGTDPKEGSSLAMAVLRAVRNKGSHSITTTHYGELKVFAYNEAGFQNASMAFDIHTFAPSYKLLTGMPGASLGIEVARRCGLPSDIIAEAKDSLEGEDLEAADLLQALEEERSRLAEVRGEAEKEALENARIQEELRKEREALKQQARERLEKSQEKARRLLEEARAEAEEVIRSLKEQQRNNPEISNRARKRLASLEAGLQPEQDEEAKSGTEHLAPGDSVKVLSLDKEGNVLEADDSRKTALIQIGIMKISLPYQDLIGIKEKKKEAYRLERVLSGKRVAMEIDLRGMTVDDAIDALGKYLDDAMLSRYPSVRIIHGMGTGALRKGIWEYLKSQKGVRSFRYGDASEGSIGATVVEL